MYYLMPTSFPKTRVLEQCFWEFQSNRLSHEWYWTFDFFFSFLPGFIPVCSLGVAQVGRMNFGKDVSTLKYFTICGLQEGYEPFAVNTNRDITMWLSKRLPQFLQVPSNHEHIEVCFFFKIQTIAKIQGWNECPYTWEFPPWIVIATYLKKWPWSVTWWWNPNSAWGSDFRHFMGPLLSNTRLNLNKCNCNVNFPNCLWKWLKALSP